MERKVHNQDDEPHNRGHHVQTVCHTHHISVITKVENPSYHPEHVGSDKGNPY
jgi:hypothetical protein